MRILTIPNWSFGRDRDLLNRFREALDDPRFAVHYLRSDVDHNRTVSAFSGDADDVLAAVGELCRLAFDRIDLNRHVGAHPRIGALDVCPFLLLPEPGPPAASVSTGSARRTGAEIDAARLLVAAVETFAAGIAARFELPIFLYEKSERGRHEADLPSLRKGGFGDLADRELNPDFGPSRAHPRIGVTVVGVREPLIAMNVCLQGDDPAVANELAREVRALRAAGDPRFLGVRALGFSLPSAGVSQVSLNLTLPDITSADPLVEWVMAESARRGGRYSHTELIGVIRRRDLSGATRLAVEPAQIVDM